ncbi:MAG TPA: sugar ABC transporter permease [Candidatus Tectomicrobia bacterium]|nr:sugar ABC transporter permease [Candidatus Tectomicrobia bacterium]
MRLIDHLQRPLKRHALDGLMLLPLCAYLVAFAAVPVLSCIVLSFTEAGSNLFPTWQNYRALFRDRVFHLALGNTLWLTGLGVSLQLLVGLGIAMTLHRLAMGRAIVRTIVLTPLGVPTIVAAVMFTYLFGTTGYLNELLSRVGLIDTPIDWTQGGWRSLGVLLVADLWKVTPLMTLILLAGLETIPEAALEAAEVDGASGWRRFWYITLPLLRPSLTMAVIIRAIDAFRIFELPLILTGKSTPVLGTLAYSEFYEYDNPFTSAAAATLLMGLIAVCLMSYLGLVARHDPEVS